MIANTDGTISEGNDARKIIYPGAGGDPWWDTNQLLEQMHMKAIPIFLTMLIQDAKLYSSLINLWPMHHLAQML